jgi:hypothetical protein
MRINDIAKRSHKYVIYLIHASLQFFLADLLSELLHIVHFYVSAALHRLLLEPFERDSEVKSLMAPSCMEHLLIRTLLMVLYLQYTPRTKAGYVYYKCLSP